MHNYHDTHRTFPPGYVVMGGASCPNQVLTADMRAPYSVLILPYIEQSPLYNKFIMTERFSLNIQYQGTATNHAAQLTPNPAFWCPSDPLGTSFHSNYFACAGGGAPTTSGCAASSDANFISFTNGIFYTNSRTRMADIIDGTTNTYLMGESKYMVHPSVNAGKHSFWSGGLYVAGNWRYYTNIAAAVEGINQPYTGTDPAGANSVEPIVPRTFGSRHEGGCHMMMADGSVHFMSENMNLDTHRTLGTRADGLPIGGLQ